MNLCRKTLLNNIKNKKLIAISGSGGKTTTMKSLALAYKELGDKVLITTSTKIAHPINYNYEYDRFFTTYCDNLEEPNKNSITLYANSFEKNKLKSPPLDEIINLTNYYDVVIYEADGSRRLPLKIHSDRDPVIVKGTTCVIEILGLIAYNKDLKDNMFLYDRYKELTNDTNTIFNYDVFKNLYDHSQGIRKNANNIQEILLFNQGDTLSDNNLKLLNKSLDYDNIKALILSYTKDIIYRNL